MYQVLQQHSYLYTPSGECVKKLDDAPFEVWYVSPAKTQPIFGLSTKTLRTLLDRDDAIRALEAVAAVLDSRIPPTIRGRYVVRCDTLRLGEFGAYAEAMKVGRVLQEYIPHETVKVETLELVDL